MQNSTLRLQYTRLCVQYLPNQPSDILYDIENVWFALLSFIVVYPRTLGLQLQHIVVYSLSFIVLLKFSRFSLLADLAIPQPEMLQARRRRRTEHFWNDVEIGFWVWFNSPPSRLKGDDKSSYSFFMLTQNLFNRWSSEHKTFSGRAEDSIESSSSSFGFNTVESACSLKLVLILLHVCRLVGKTIALENI